MISKTLAKNKKTCKVTFKTRPEIYAVSVSIVGDFNNWNPAEHPMTRRKDGSFSATLNLKTGATYKFRYYIDGNYWENDEQADALTPNCFGTEDSQIIL